MAIAFIRWFIYDYVGADRASYLVYVCRKDLNCVNGAVDFKE